MHLLLVCVSDGVTMRALAVAKITEQAVEPSRGPKGFIDLCFTMGSMQYIFILSSPLHFAIIADGSDDRRLHRSKLTLSYVPILHGQGS